MNVDRFRMLMQAALLSTGPFAAFACSSSGEPTPMPERAQCIDLRSPSRYAALSLRPDIDGIAFATRTTDIARSPDAVVPSERLTEVGTPCLRATDRDACSNRVAELLADPSVQGWFIYDDVCQACGPIGEDFAVITAGDEVRAARFDDIVAAATPIDTLGEAAALLRLKLHGLDCEGNNARTEPDGWTFKRTSTFCDGEISETFFRVRRDGTIVESGRNVVEEGDNSCIEGRRPNGLAPTSSPWLSSLRACFSEIAHMEAAAVIAFDELERQLRALGAPDALLVRARRARADEVAHARITAALAERFGGRAPAPRVGPGRDLRAPDALVRLAVENAVEGCVREAYGALVAAHQAGHASDPSVREAFARIAVDEAAHAELSFALDEWLTERLSEADRTLVAHAKASAWADLAVACAVEPAEEVVTVAGMPTAAQARVLLAELRWASLSAVA